MIDKITSKRLALLRFPLIVGVVFIHSYETTVRYASGESGLNSGSVLAEFIRYFVSQEVARMGVELLPGVRATAQR